MNLLSHPYVQRHLKSYYGGLMAEESIAVLARYDPDALEYIMKGKGEIAHEST